MLVAKHPPEGLGEAGGDVEAVQQAIEKLLRGVLLARSNRAATAAGLINALAGLPVQDPRLKRLRLAQYLPGGSACRSGEHEPLARALLALLFEARPALVGALLADSSPSLVRAFFERKRGCVPAWFGHFGGGGAGGGLRDFRHGAAALAQYALAHRGEAWDLLVWGGRHAQAPVAVAQRPHYFAELDVPATVDSLLRSCRGFWESREMRAATATGAILALDPDFWACEMHGWLVERSRRSEELYGLACDLVEGTDWRTLCQRLLPALPAADLPALASGLLDGVPYPGGGGGGGGGGEVAAAGPAPLPGQWLVFRGAAWGGLEDLWLAAALGCGLPQALRTVCEDEGDAEEMGRLVAALQAGEGGGAHWQMRRDLMAQRQQQSPLQLRLFLLTHLWAAHFSIARLARSPGGAAEGSSSALQALLQGSGVTCEPVAGGGGAGASAARHGGSSGKKRKKGKKERKERKKLKEHRSGRSAKRRRGRGSSEEEEEAPLLGGGTDDSSDGGGEGSAAAPCAWRLQEPGAAPVVVSSLELVDRLTNLIARSCADTLFAPPAAAAPRR